MKTLSRIVILVILSLVLVAAVSACGNKENTAEPASPEPAEVAPEPAPVEAPPAEDAGATDEAEPPTAADFEEQAEEEITTQNLQEQVDQLAQEIGEPAS